LLLLLLLLAGVTRAGAQAASGPLTVFNAGSLAASFRELLQAFARRHAGVDPRQESSGSLEAARKLTDLGRVPDVIAVADYQVLANLIVPKHADWYATFSRNAMVILYSDRSTGAKEITRDNWWQVIQRPGVRTGRSDPALDPNGYRTLMVTQLAERHYRQPGLTARLLAAMPPRWVRPKEADLVALVQAGELDYAWSYRNIAVTTGLRSVSLPPEVDLSDPGLEATYRQATVRVPAGGGADSLTLTGEPIVYALTVPRKAPNPAAGAAFVRFVFSPDGQAILRRHGYILLDRPRVVGRPPAGVIPQ
jgi:molybdate/tungstate transport system substrate-binding protein